MQQAISYKLWPPIHTIDRPAVARPSSKVVDKSAVAASSEAEQAKCGTAEDVQGVARENAIVVFGRRGCCMTHVVKRLLLGLGVNPPVYEVDEADEARTAEKLRQIGGGDDQLQFPTVFIGGRLFGGLDRVMATHITGELVPVLKQAGALWL